MKDNSPEVTPVSNVRRKHLVSIAVSAGNCNLPASELPAEDIYVFDVVAKFASRSLVPLLHQLLTSTLCPSGRCTLRNSLKPSFEWP